MVLGNEKIASIVPPLVIPLDPDLIQPASLDIRFGTEVRRSSGEIQTLCLGDVARIRPGEAFQVASLERCNFPEEISGMVRLKSSAARAWLALAGGEWIDPGYRGNLTLSMKNNGDQAYTIVCGKPFAQIIFFETSGVGAAYAGQYQDSCGLTPAKS